MLNFFHKKKPICPIAEETRIWMENALIWLINQFTEQKLLGVKTLRPTAEHFPIEFDDLEKTAAKLIPIVATQMDLSSDYVHMEFYSETAYEIVGELGNTIYTQHYDNETSSTGLYLGKDANGKFLVAVEKSQLKDVENLVATLAHEFGHIKLLGEDKLKVNDESLTDLITVFYGLGIFGANSAVKFYSNLKGWAYSRQSYFTQQEWGYALALYAHIRREINPTWLEYLTTNVKSDFLKSQDFILHNQDKVLV